MDSLSVHDLQRAIDILYFFVKTRQHPRKILEILKWFAQEDKTILLVVLAVMIAGFLGIDSRVSKDIADAIARRYALVFGGTLSVHKVWKMLFGCKKHCMRPKDLAHIVTVLPPRTLFRYFKDICTKIVWSIVTLGVLGGGAVGFAKYKKHPQFSSPTPVALNEAPTPVALNEAQQVLTDLHLTYPETLEAFEQLERSLAALQTLASTNQTLASNTPVSPIANVFGSVHPSTPVETSPRGSVKSNNVRLNLSRYHLNNQSFLNSSPISAPSAPRSYRSHRPTVQGVSSTPANVFGSETPPRRRVTRSVAQKQTQSGLISEAVTMVNRMYRQGQSDKNIKKAIKELPSEKQREAGRRRFEATPRRSRY